MFKVTSGIAPTVVEYSANAGQLFTSPSGFSEAKGRDLDAEFQRAAIVRKLRELDAAWAYLRSRMGKAEIPGHVQMPSDFDTGVELIDTMTRAFEHAAETWTRPNPDSYPLDFKDNSGDRNFLFTTAIRVRVGDVFDIEDSIDKHKYRVRVTGISVDHDRGSRTAFVDTVRRVK